MDGLSYDSKIINFQQTITGTVSDELGPLPGATVQVKGTSVGVTTDFDGNYSIEADSDAILVVSYLGYATKEVAINGQQTLNVQLQPDATQLEDVVVVGYGTTAKKDVTGAISSVKAEEIENLPVANVEKALQGRMSGVQVVNNGGAPGGETKIRIRGTGTVNNSDPLYVVDGVPTSNINGLNQNNIASLEVLKDASASAIYGTRAANGVVIITTKKGTKGQKPSINLNAYTGFSNVRKTIDVLTAPQLAEIKIERSANDGAEADAVWNDPQYLNQTTDWQDEIFETGYTNNADFSVTGAGENSSYLVGFGYYDEQGILSNSFANRLTFQLNTDTQVTDWLKINQNLSISRRKTNSPNTSSSQSGVIASALRFHPGLPVYLADGNYSTTQVSSEFGDINNPLHTINEDNDLRQANTRLLGNIQAEIKLYDGLSFKANFGLDGEISDRKRYYPQILDQTRNRGLSSLEREYSEFYSILQEYFLSYNKLFGDHSVGAVAGYTEQSFENQGFYAQANNINDSESEKILSNGDNDNATEFRSHDGLRSMFARVNYGYKNRYLLTATFRSDESSRFAEGNQRGNFPAFSAGWRISEESFFNVPLIDNLKISGGWGQLGNQNIDRLQYLATLTAGNRYSFGQDGQVQVEGISQSTYANPDVTWETVEMTNFGLETSLFDYRLAFNANYFIKNTEDMLLRLPAIGSQGTATAPFKNAGEVQNKGLELELGWNDQKGDFSYGVSANASFISNKVVSLLENQDYLTSDPFSRTGQELSRTYIGEPIATFYGYKSDGLFQSEAEVNAHALQEGAQPGDVRFQDLNNDGVIDDNDRMIIGSPHPDVTYGLNLDFGYKNFDLTAFFVGVGGVDIFNAEKTVGMNSSFNFNYHAEILDRWTGPGTSNSIPRVTFNDENNNFRTSDLFIESGDYFRLKNLTLGYTLPQDITEKYGIGKLRLYLSGQNVFTITGYSGFDPELGLTNGNLQQNVDTAQFPQSRTYLLGVNLTF